MRDEVVPPGIIVPDLGSVSDTVPNQEDKGYDVGLWAVLTHIL